MRNIPSRTRRVLAAVVLAVTLASCTPQEIAAWQQHLAEESARQAASPEAEIRRAFADGGASPAVQDQAVRVAWCESRFDPRAVSSSGGHVGTFQLASRYHRARAEALGFSWQQVSTETYANARTAVSLLAAVGWRWSPTWACSP